MLRPKVGQSENESGFISNLGVGFRGAGFPVAYGFRSKVGFDRTDLLICPLKKELSAKFADCILS